MSIQSSIPFGHRVINETILEGWGKLVMVIDNLYQDSIYYDSIKDNGTK